MPINRLIDNRGRSVAAAANDGSERRSSPEQRERILEAATRLFAQHGYHAVSTRQIARAVELNIATVNYHVGGKRDLYRAVVERLYEEEQSALGGHLADLSANVGESRRTLSELSDLVVDALVRLLAQQPARPRLLMHRWLEPRDELADIDAQFSIPFFRQLRDLLENARRAGTIRGDVDIDYFIRSFSWMLYGYFASGPIDWDGWYGDPQRAENLARLTAHLQGYTRRMLEPPAKGRGE